MTLHTNVLAAILEHARAEAPCEACGFVVNETIYVPCKNIMPDEEGPDGNRANFSIDPMGMVAAEKLGEITAVVHSHPGTNAQPTETDMSAIEDGDPKVRWIIVCPDDGSFTETDPTGYIQPLTGRTFRYGTNDCFSLTRDYFKRVLNVDLQDYERPKPKAFKLGQVEAWGMENGFEKVRDLKLHDVIGMSIEMRGPDQITNHLAVYVGDNKILQHLRGHKSMKFPWGGYWEDAATGFWRRK